jgi:hypothetical protein
MEGEDGFNENHLKIAGSILKCLDGSMSAFWPWMTKKGSFLGGLPHILFILHTLEAQTSTQDRIQGTYFYLLPLS